MPFCQEFRSAWKNATPGHDKSWQGIAAHLRTMRNTLGIVTPLGSEREPQGLLNYLVAELAIDDTIPTAAAGEPDTNHETAESTRRCVENALFVATRPGDASAEARNESKRGDWQDSQAVRAGWREGDWPVWRANLAAVCLRMLREQRAEVSGSRGGDAESKRRRCLRLAWLWETLLPDTDLPYWLPQSGHGPSTGAPRAFQVIDLLDCLQPQVQEIWFPTAVDSSAAASSGEGCILLARVSLFHEPGEPHAREWFALLPQPPAGHCFVAPWSPIALSKGTLDKLRTELGHAGGFGLQAGERVMIELAPVPKSPIPALIVHGLSLSVSTLLAIWSARESEVLYPIVVTGQVNSGQIQAVETETISAKLAAIRTAFPAQADMRCLLPCENFDYLLRQREIQDVHTFPGSSPPLRCGESEGLRIIELPKSLNDLTALKDQLLTDGFGDYRKQLGANSQDWHELPVRAADDDGPGVYLADDRQYLEARVACAGLEGKALTFWQEQNGSRTAHRECIVSLPFDNDPLPAVQFILASLFRLVSTASNPNTVAIPLPLALSKVIAPADERTTMADLMRTGIRAALGDLTLEDKVSERVLQTVVRGWDWSKLCLVAYAAPSTQVDYEQQRAVLARLRQGPPHPQAPAIFFLASDDHHARFIHATWSGQPAAP